MADNVLFSLTYVKQNPIQAMQGQLLGMSQSHANKWVPLLHTVLNRAVADHDLLPARTADELAARLAKPQTEATSTAPLVGMLVRSGRSSGRKILRSQANSTVGRSSGTRSKTSS